MTPVEICLNQNKDTTLGVLVMGSTTRRKLPIPVQVCQAVHGGSHTRPILGRLLPPVTKTNGKTETMLIVIKSRLLPYAWNFVVTWVDAILKQIAAWCDTEFGTFEFLHSLRGCVRGDVV